MIDAVQGDNQGVCESDNRNPFKGPFKGKGENRLALRELETELDKIHDEMDILVERFNEVFRQPRPVHLRQLRKRKYSLLWWRMVGKSGTFIQLFNSDKGDEVLTPLMGETRKMLMEFDKERIRLNFRASVVGNALEAYRRRERDLASLDQINMIGSVA